MHSFSLSSAEPKDYAYIVPVVAALVALVRIYLARRGTSSSSVTSATLKGPPVRPRHPQIQPPAAAIAGSPGGMNRQTSPVQSIRDRLGNPPRTFDRSLNKYLQVDRPSWLRASEDPELAAAYARQAETR